MKTKYILSTLLIVLAITVNSQAVEYRFSFLGKYDFTMIGNTLNETENGSGGICSILTQSSANLNLNTGQDIEAAYLYWAGSGSLVQADLNVKLNGTDITAERTFSTTIGATQLPVFGAFADVTTQVQNEGNGNYTLSDLDLTSIIWPYCIDNGGGGTNFGGWSIVIVYKDLSLSNNLVNVYDGFGRVDQGYNNITIQLDNLNVLNLVGNRIGFLAWEGDDFIANGEELRINDNIVSNPPLNPANNAFNGTNSFTYPAPESFELWNMDLDFYDINNYTSIGDETLVIKLQSLQDAVIINNIVVVLNSEVPDATIEAEPTIGGCDDRDINVDYTVHNTIATKDLPANTPIAFYADGVLVGSSATQNPIVIGGSESGSITLTIPTTIPNNFTFLAKVDDDGAGNSTVIEFLETNNTHQEQILLGTTPTILPADNLVLCDLNDDGTEAFDLTVPGNQILGTQTGLIIRYYIDPTDADAGNGDNILTPNNYTNVSPNETIHVRLEDPFGCYVVTSFTIEIIPSTNITHTIQDMVNCIDGPSTTGILTDLTMQETFILNGNNPLDYTISYHTSEASARQGTVTIPTPDAYPNISNPQVIWVRMVSNEHCVEVGSFNLIYNLNPVVSDEIFESCSFTQFATYNLSEINDDIVADPTGLEFSYHLTQLEAENEDNPLPINYENTIPNQVIFVRVENSDGCYSIAEVTLTTLILHEQITNVIQQCDDPTKINDGKSLFDLTVMDIPVENALGGSGFTISYHSSLTEAQNGTAPITDPTEFENTSNPQILYARATGGDGSCGGTAEFEIEVLEVPEFELPDYIAFCADEVPMYEFGESFVTYIWKDASGDIIGNTATVEFQNEGMHTLEVTNNTNNCPAIREVEVILDNAPTIMNIEVNGNNVSVFPTGGEAPYQYSYDNGLTWHDYFILDNVPSGVFEMLVKSKYGCVSIGKMFGVLGIPNLITPNGDGYNDYWDIRALEMYPDASIKIFDRYGKMFMDRKMDSDFRWNGQYMGRPLPSGSYWYIITIEKDKSISGHITIKNQ